MKFEFTKEWTESVPLEDDLLDPSAGRLSYDPVPSKPQGSDPIVAHARSSEVSAPGYPDGKQQRGGIDNSRT